MPQQIKLQEYISSEKTLFLQNHMMDNVPCRDPLLETVYVANPLDFLEQKFLENLSFIVFHNSVSDLLVSEWVKKHFPNVDQQTPCIVRMFNEVEHSLQSMSLQKSFCDAYVSTRADLSFLFELLRHKMSSRFEKTWIIKTCTKNGKLTEIYFGVPRS